MNQAQPLTTEQALNMLLRPCPWDLATAATAMKGPVASLAGAEVPSLYTRVPDAWLIPRPPDSARFHPAQVWARYPGPHPAFVITSLKGEGIWAQDSTHRVDVHTAKQAFDPNDSDYLLDQYEIGNAFAFVLGVPAFLAHARAMALTWAMP